MSGLEGTGVAGLMNLSQYHQQSRDSRNTSPPPSSGHILTRRSSEGNVKLSLNGTTANGAISSLPPSTPPPTQAQHSISRRPSWLANISSKFSSSVHHESAPATPTTVNAATVNASALSSSSASHEKGGHQPGFLMSTLRRLSVSGSSAREALTRRNTIAHAPPSERIVLNRDKFRERCCIPELDGIKLRKVAFCVDVEVAPSQEDIEARKEARRKRREAREKEKERLKALEADEAVSEKPAGENIPAEKRDSEDNTAENKPGEEKSEGKEAAGINQGPESPAALSPPDTAPPPPATNPPKEKKSRRRIHARPTTDPLKIYSQCCQLRETHVVPHIKEQLLKAAGAAVLQELDLTGYKFNVADCVAFSDFLALVPIKQLVLEDCDLTDEMVRVILSALSAVKTPLPDGMEPARPANEKHHERGVVERLSFKNNGRIGVDGWQYISCFIHMSHSLRAIDLSKITLPRPPHGLLHSLTHSTTGGRQGHSGTVSPAGSGKERSSDPTSNTFAKALAERLVGYGLDELVMGHCCLTLEQLATIMDGVVKGGTKRLGLEGNAITDDGLAIIGRWIRGADGPGSCEGLDLSNNKIEDHIDILSASIKENSNIRALNLSNCNLTPSSLSSLLPALSQVTEFRWLDLSHNPLLFSIQPDALPLLRLFLPHLKSLRKLDLSNTSLTADHVIALCEVLPEAPALAYFAIADNHLIPSGQTDMDQEEGAALYAALIVAVEVSKTIVRVDIDEPGPAASSVVRNLSKRLLAYCLKNIEAGAAGWDFGESLGFALANSILSPTTPHPDMDDEVRKDDEERHNSALDDLDKDDLDYEYDDRGIWRDEETYVVGGTGVVKALGVCLGNKPPPAAGGVNQAVIDAATEPLARSTTASSFSGVAFDEVQSPEKAKEMSKALLARARKIKMKIQPALRKSYSGEEEEFHHRRLLFLDATLHRVIHRFEQEYPECREPSIPPLPLLAPSTSPSPSPSNFTPSFPPTLEEPLIEIARPLSRRPSEVSLHARSLQEEEARMLKMRGRVLEGNRGERSERNGQCEPRERREQSESRLSEYSQRHDDEEEDVSPSTTPPPPASPTPPPRSSSLPPGSQQ
ncbi:RNI-like protein [Ascodesmis nigricans]|uniref:RNI-like protein n=1 Tax=Ascodesmis nigricans TaxID=341454 RepID=A0A4S2MQM7_9PEZI|nr:RNI-like protein [Ascodesmis nigricans]